MKVRSDFVTNSSSSNFVIAYKQIDDKYGKLVDIIIRSNESSIMRQANEFANDINELNKQFIEHLLYCYGRKYVDCLIPAEEFEDEEQLYECYKKAVQMIKDGYSVIFKYIDNDDDNYLRIIRAVIDGDNVIMIYGEE